MTLIVGSVNDGGVLLCGDTLVSSEVSVSYESKILPVVFSDGRALIGYSGNAVFGKGAVEQIRLSLSRYNGGPRSLEYISDHIRKVWYDCFRKSHSGNALSYEQILVALWSKRDQDAKLYCSSNEVFAQSASGEECIGCGDLLGRFLIGSSGGTPAVAERRAFERAVIAVGLTKQSMPTSVGGNLVAVNLSKDGTARVYSFLDLYRVENYALDIDRSVRELAERVFSTIGDDTRFSEAVAAFTEGLMSLSKCWKSDLTWKMIDYLPPEAAQIQETFSKPV